MDLMIRKKLSSKAKHPLLFSIPIFVFAVALLCSDKCHCTDSNSAAGRKNDCYSMDEIGLQENEDVEVSLSSERRSLSGPGSFPPRCTSRCGNCSPCKPVHVAVPPGTPVTTEYYPEAWRCKCGNKLYMP
ncbi:EPIDERMAL PATTERNING FACTOR-like protein 4 [Nymphaea colorata]|nr:EPIDERMAL PATTERNING FACTOR-like protein 4 [Nymphaea colorata]